MENFYKILYAWYKNYTIFNKWELFKIYNICLSLRASKFQKGIGITSRALTLTKTSRKRAITTCHVTYEFKF